ILATMPCQVHRQALVSRLPKQVANRHQVGLDTAVRRRVRPELHHPHTSSATGAPLFADAIIARHPSVARAPSRTVTAGARPFRMLSAKSAICAKYPLSGHIFDLADRVPRCTPVRLKSSVNAPT